ncbi:MAG: O-antigen ligase family protein [Ignavibacteriales bacterium]|nr:O-antigen ligase family protein [Ignavibacteriales bacterium]
MMRWRSGNSATVDVHEVLSHPESDWGSRMLVVGVVIVALLASAIVVFTGGNLIAGAAFLGALTVLLTTLYRLDLGFLLFVGAVLALDQYHIPGFEPLTFQFGYFRNVKEIAYLPSFGAAVFNPLELHLLLLIFVWFFVLGIQKERQLIGIHGWGVALAFFFGLICFLLYGLREGGELLVAVWEVRALMYLGVLYFFVPQVIQTKEQLVALVWVCIAAISLKALQGIVRYVTMGFTFNNLPTLTNHEDPVFMLTLVILLFGFAVMHVRHSQVSILLLLLLPLLIGFFVAQRRAAYAAILPSFAAFVVLLSQQERLKLFKTVLPVVGVLGLYTAVFWESESRFASPVRLVKSGLTSDRETAGERYYSNLYRDFEKINLAKTVQTSPVVGIGFGNKYEMPIPLATISFPLRDYIPHNQVLWIIAKTGVVGFFLFWFFFDAFAFRVASISTRLRDPYLRVVCAMAVAAVIGQIVVSYFDMQLTYYRNMVYLGILMGLPPALEVIDSESPAAKE